MLLRGTATKGIHMGERSLKATGKEANGALVIIRPSELAKAGTTGTVAEGIYEGSKPNKFDDAKKDYFIRNQESGTLFIINETKGLAEQLDQLSADDLATVRVEYSGKIKTKNGKGYHNFEVFVVDATRAV